MKLLCVVLLEFLLSSVPLHFSYASADNKHSITTLEFPMLLVTALQKAGIFYFEDLAQLSERQVRRLDGIGPIFRRQIRAKLTEKGLIPKPQPSHGVAVTDRSIDTLNLPQSFRDASAARDILTIGQLMLLSEKDLTRYTHAPTIELLKNELNSLNLKLNTPDPRYDTPLFNVLSRSLALKFKEYDLITMRELSVLTLQECELIAEQSMKRTTFHVVQQMLEQKAVRLGEFPFTDLPLGIRLWLYRHSIRTEEAAKEFLRDSDEMSQRLSCDEWFGQT